MTMFPHLSPLSSHEPEYLTIAGVQEVFGLKRTQICQLIEALEVRAIRINERYVLVDARSLRRYLGLQPQAEVWFSWCRCYGTARCHHSCRADEMPSAIAAE